MDYLFKIFKSCSKLALVPVQRRRNCFRSLYWQSQPPNTSEIEDFCPIALLNVEGKLLFSLVSKRLEHYIHKNKFVNVSIQKGCMEKVPGCWEHMPLVWEELKQAKPNKHNIAAVWLDIANAYGSVQHELIFFALECYGIRPKWVQIIKSYYSGIWSHFFSLMFHQGGTSTFEVYFKAEQCQ